MDNATWDYTTDEIDRRLLVVDVTGSIAHATMLGETEIISRQEAEVVVDGLRQILSEAAAGDFEFADTDEDVHSAVERRLGEIVGDVAGKLHTGRSRNDQVALDLRLYLKKSGESRIEELHRLTGTLAQLADEHAETVIPSYTHLQQAQTTTLGHHLLAYAWMALRSADRLRDALRRVGQSPLGAGASAGSSLKLDRDAVAAKLGLDGVIPNSLDAVGARDFVAEYVFCCAQAMIDFSRLAEEIVLWSSVEFGWVQLSDEVSTGSSALPQKRNPDIAELIRGRSSAVTGDMAAILTLQKALPLSYNRDLQEDKRIVFHADDSLADATAAMLSLLGGISFTPPPPRPETAALDLAEALVRRGVPFREAHTLVGEVVALLESAGRTFADLTIEDLHAVDSRFLEEDVALLDLSVSVQTRATSGSGSPESVREQVRQMRELI